MHTPIGHPDDYYQDLPEHPARHIEQPADTLTAALAYADRGWHVFPLIPGSKRPAVKDWPNVATTDTEPIRQWFSPHRPGRPFGIGIATGPSRLVVLDLDHKPEHGITWQGGWTTLQRLGWVRRTRVVRTPSGGWHLYYLAPGPNVLRNTASKLGPGIDTRAAGGYVAAPPTTLPGGAYTLADVAPPVGFVFRGVAVLPVWLEHALTAPEPTAPAPPAPVVTGSGRASAYLDAAVNAETHRVRDAQPGQRNHALFIAAIALGQLAAGGALPADTVRALLLDASAGHLQAGAFTRTEADRTIDSGLRRGATRPRRIAA